MGKKNQGELLKLSYDWNKTVLLTVLVILVATSFSANQANGIFGIAVDLLLIACLIVGIVYFFRTKKSISDLNNFYK